MPDAALPRTGFTLTKNDGTDPADEFRLNIRAIGAWIESNGPMYAEGALASRPTVGKHGRWYKPSDAGYESIIYYDDGTTWQTIGAGAPADPAAGTPGLRTLGSGATQAAAGNHSHAIGAIVGVGGAASLNVGTTTGTVADGGVVNDLLVLHIMGAI